MCWPCLLSTVRQERAHIADDDHDPHTKAGHTMRAALFADWLLTILPFDQLARGSGVYDVAGGRGAVSFELHTKRGIHCTLIDPRERKLDKFQHRHLRAHGGVLCPQLQRLFDPDLFIDPDQGESRCVGLSMLAF
eukprot:m.619176 g.619176  ORF g.619176 m.619176 type:complete len:135 (+) comp58196_c0_seq4:702-1106(+)